MAGSDDAIFDGLVYCAANRAAVVLDSRVPTTILKSKLWRECATNPAAVAFNNCGSSGQGLVHPARRRRYHHRCPR